MTSPRRLVAPERGAPGQVIGAMGRSRAEDPHDTSGKDYAQGLVSMGKRSTPVTAEEFERLTGRKATEKYLEWANCTANGRCFHWRCGWCEVEGCNLPTFMCGHPRPRKPEPASDR